MPAAEAFRRLDLIRTAQCPSPICRTHPAHGTLTAIDQDKPGLVARQLRAKRRLDTVTDLANRDRDGMSSLAMGKELPANAGGGGKIWPAPYYWSDRQMTATGVQIVRDAAFVLRCAGAAALSYLLAQAIDLPHPVWATMSGIIVGQEHLGETGQATLGRLLGTIIGVAMAVSVGELAGPLGAGLAVQIAVSVALCAIVARRFPALRVCMWTCPIVFLTAVPATPLYVAGYYRGAEVLLGGVVGALLHVVAELAIRKIVVDEAPA